MKVKELIEALQGANPESEVFVDAPENDEWIEVKGCDQPSANAFLIVAE